MFMQQGWSVPRVMLVMGFVLGFGAMPLSQAAFPTDCPAACGTSCGTTGLSTGLTAAYDAINTYVTLPNDSDGGGIYDKAHLGLVERVLQTGALNSYCCARAAWDDNVTLVNAAVEAVTSPPPNWALIKPTLKTHLTIS